jgi:hypothetical protein
MSNCVAVFHDIVIPKDVLEDADKFLADVREASYAEWESERWIEHHLTWYVRDTLDDQGSAILWRVGEGCSEHTWRDLYGTIRAIGTYMKSELMFTAEIDVMDTDSGENKQRPYFVILAEDDWWDDFEAEDPEGFQRAQYGSYNIDQFYTVNIGIVEI